MRNSPFPVLDTERLLLRRVSKEDAEVVLAGYSDPRINQFMSVAYHSLYEVKVQLDCYEKLLVDQSGIWWGICLKESGQMIGNGGFHDWHHQHRKAEIGYWLLPEFQGRGLASEAVNAMLNYGFDKMILHRIEAEVEVGNTASSALLTKNGFILEGIRKECEIINEKFINIEMWAKLEKIKMA